MNHFVTFKLTFDPNALPKRFAPLRDHVGYVSIKPSGNDEEAGIRDGDAIAAVIARWLESLRSIADEQEFKRIRRAICREALDWNASVFDVFGIDVTSDRLLAHEASALGGELPMQGIDSPPAEDGEELHPG